MAKVYVTLCIVKKDGKSYNKGSVIKGLTDEEIKRGLAEHWLEAVGQENDDDADDGDDEEPAEKKPSKSPKNEKPGKPGKEKSGKPDRDDLLEKMTADELIAEAVNLGLLRADESMPAEELRKIIREARQ
jgi:hypothetical protein